MSAVESIARLFQFGGEVADIRPYGKGLINDTYLVAVSHTPSKYVVLQRLNGRVFPDPIRIVENLRTLLDHLHQCQASNISRELQFPQLYSNKKQRDYAVDQNGDVWRAISFIENSRALTALAHPTQAAAVGYALGRFHFLVHDLDPQRLKDTLRGFHVTPRYLARFDEIISLQRNTLRNPVLEFCFNFVEAHRDLAKVLEAAKENGELTTRPVHGDPKLDNFLFDEDADQVVSLIDLDTVQAGLIQYDIGDCLRSCCNPVGENPADPKQAYFDIHLCQALLEAYLVEARTFLTSNDFDYIYPAMRLIPFELGLRFLTDHLEGNIYFKTDRPQQNLQRALTQFRLCESIEQQEKAIKTLIAKYAEH